MNSNDIHGSSPKKFGHRIRKHVFETAVRNEEDSLTELLRKRILNYSSGNEPFTIENNTSKIHRANSNAILNSKNMLERNDLVIKNEPKVVEVPTIRQALIQSTDRQDNYNRIDKLNLNTKSKVDPIQNYYGSYITERAQILLPDIISGSWHVDDKPANVTFDETRKSMTRLDANKLSTPSILNNAELNQK